MIYKRNAAVCKVPGQNLNVTVVVKKSDRQYLPQVTGDTSCE